MSDEPCLPQIIEVERHKEPYPLSEKEGFRNRRLVMAVIGMGIWFVVSGFGGFWLLIAPFLGKFPYCYPVSRFLICCNLATLVVVPIYLFWTFFRHFIPLFFSEKTGPVVHLKKNLQDTADKSLDGAALKWILYWAGLCVLEGLLFDLNVSALLHIFLFEIVFDRFVYYQVFGGVLAVLFLIESFLLLFVAIRLIGFRLYGVASLPAALFLLHLSIFTLLLFHSSP